MVLDIFFHGTNFFESQVFFNDYNLFSRLCISRQTDLNSHNNIFSCLSPDTDIQSHLNKIQIYHKTRFIIAKLFHES